MTEKEILNKLLEWLMEGKKEVNALYKAYYSAIYNDWKTAQSVLYSIDYDMDIRSLEVYEQIAQFAKSQDDLFQLNEVDGAMLKRN